jgi:cystathionine gamma-synthase
MSVFKPIPLGQRIPGSPHSVACSLPTMANVIGYEEGRPETTRHIASGYPRFVVHTHAKRLCEHLARRPELAGKSLWLVTSARMAAALADHLGRSGPAAATPFTADRIDGVAHADTPALNARAKVYLQHIGGFLSSRAAEDHLVRLRQLPIAAPEKLFPGDATAEIRRVLRAALPVADPDLLLAPSGMNALYASFRAISTVQARAGRTAWLQLGWLYLDSIALLRKFTPDPARDYLRHGDVTDLAGLEKLFATHGPRLAGLIIEAPTNPLIQTADLAAVTALARRHGAKVILDPAVSSPFNVDLLPHADLVATSLTKYTAHEGDVIAGAVAVNAARPDAAELRDARRRQPRAHARPRPRPPRRPDRRHGRRRRPHQRQHPQGCRVPRVASGRRPSLVGAPTRHQGQLSQDRPLTPRRPAAWFPSRSRARSRNSTTPCASPRGRASA